MIKFCKDCTFYLDSLHGELCRLQKNKDANLVSGTSRVLCENERRSAAFGDTCGPKAKYFEGRTNATL
jgi:hypothetical protein